MPYCVGCFPFGEMRPRGALAKPDASDSASRTGSPFPEELEGPSQPGSESLRLPVPDWASGPACYCDGKWSHRYTQQKQRGAMNAREKFLNQQFVEIQSGTV